MTWRVLALFAALLLMAFISWGMSPERSPLHPGREFPDVPISAIASGKWIRPRAAVVGNVSFTKKEPDGDLHIKLTDDTGKFVVCEIIPELPQAGPKVNDKISVWGIVRYDAMHKWWEIHPVINWRKTSD